MNTNHIEVQNLCKKFSYLNTNESWFHKDIKHKFFGDPFSPSGEVALRLKEKYKIFKGRSIEDIPLFKETSIFKEEFPLTKIKDIFQRIPIQEFLNYYSRLITLNEYLFITDKISREERDAQINKRKLSYLAQRFEMAHSSYKIMSGLEKEKDLFLKSNELITLVMSHYETSLIENIVTRNYEIQYGIKTKKEMPVSETYLKNYKDLFETTFFFRYVPMDDVEYAKQKKYLIKTSITSNDINKNVNMNEVTWSINLILLNIKSNITKKNDPLYPKFDNIKNKFIFAVVQNSYSDVFFRTIVRNDSLNGYEIIALMRDVDTDLHSLSLERTPLNGTLWKMDLLNLHKGTSIEERIERSFVFFPSIQRSLTNEFMEYSGLYNLKDILIEKKKEMWTEPFIEKQSTLKRQMFETRLGEEILQQSTEYFKKFEWFYPKEEASTDIRSKMGIISIDMYKKAVEETESTINKLEVYFLGNGISYRRSIFKNLIPDKFIKSDYSEYTNFLTNLLIPIKVNGQSLGSNFVDTFLLYDHILIKKQTSYGLFCPPGPFHEQHILEIYANMVLGEKLKKFYYRSMQALISKSNSTSRSKIITRLWFEEKIKKIEDTENIYKGKEGAFYVTSILENISFIIDMEAFVINLFEYKNSFIPNLDDSTILQIDELVKKEEIQPFITKYDSQYVDISLGYEDPYIYHHPFSSSRMYKYLSVRYSSSFAEKFVLLVYISKFHPMKGFPHTLSEILSKSQNSSVMYNETKSVLLSQNRELKTREIEKLWYLWVLDRQKRISNTLTEDLEKGLWPEDFDDQKKRWKSLKKKVFDETKEDYLMKVFKIHDYYDLKLGLDKNIQSISKTIEDRYRKLNLSYFIHVPIVIKKMKTEGE